MEMQNNATISPETKEACAVETMRCMLEDYAGEKNIPFEEALSLFVTSRAYGMLFDLNTDVWKEGPAYLRAIFERFN